MCTIGKATQGLDNFDNFSNTKTNINVVITYDSRNYSCLFAEESVLYLEGNGTNAYIFDSLGPT